MRCGKIDNNKQKHLQHVSTHIPAVNFQCPVCYRCLRTYVTYRRHLMQIHKNIDDQNLISAITNTSNNNLYPIEEERSISTELNTDLDFNNINNFDDVVESIVTECMNEYLESLATQSESIKTADEKIQSILKLLPYFIKASEFLIEESAYDKLSDIIKKVKELIGTNHKRMELIQKKYTILPVKIVNYSRILSPVGFQFNRAAMFSIKSIIENILSNRHIADALIFSDNFMNSNTLSHPLSGSRAQTLRQVSINAFYM